MKIEDFPQVSKSALVSLEFNFGVAWFGFLWVFFVWLVVWFWVFVSFVFPTAVNYIPTSRNRKRQEKMQTSQCWTSHMNEIKKLMLSQHCSSVEVIRGIVLLRYERRGSCCHF